MPDSAARSRYQRAAADLQWLKDQVPLYRLGAAQPDIQRHLTRPAQLSDALHAALSQDPLPRLGRYCELLFHWGLTANPQVAAVENGIIIRADGRTLGEFDFLIRPQSQTTYHHLELCVKFYLANGPLAQPPSWLGINPSDRLDIKLARLRDHQLRLSEMAPAAAWLAAQQISVSSVSGLMLGMLFFPRTADWQTAPGPLGASAGLARGWWCRGGEIAQRATEREQFIELDRLHWLAPLPVSDPARLVDSRVIAARAAQRARMVSRRGGAHEQYRELDRGLVVPDHWPLRVNPADA